MLLAVAFALSVGAVPHRELPSTFAGGRAFVMPRVANSQRRLVLWLDSDGSGFVRSGLVAQLKLQTTPQKTAYLPKFDETGFPAPTADRGALPILDDAQVAADPIFSGIDGQLGWTWFTDRMWTIDYVGRRVYQDYSAPPYPSADHVPLLFDAQHRYPQLQIEIGGVQYRAALDTAASVALSQAAIQRINDGLPRVRATSFIPRRTLEQWHATHPDWLYIANAGAGSGVAMIRVPQVRAARVTFTNVWFSTRPNDDVFEGDAVDAKLGPSAFGNCGVTIDYVHDAAGFECAPSTAEVPRRYDVLISAGHEGRPQSCARFPQHHCNLGAEGERAWTPVVADEASKQLRAMGYSVAREPADFDGRYDVKAAIFIHFDGTSKPCTSGASIGYHVDASKPAADLWRSMYGSVFPFRFKPDNFTVNLRDYYGFRQVRTQDGGLVLELGEVTCPAQRAWLAPRLAQEGDLIAQFVDRLIRRSSE